MHFSKFGSFVAFVSLRLSSHWSFGVCLLRVVVVLGLVSGECFFRVSFTVVLLLGVSTTLDRFHRCSSGGTFPPGPHASHNRRSVICSRAFEPGSSSLCSLPPFPQHLRFSCPQWPRLSTPTLVFPVPFLLSPRPGRFCFPALPRSFSRRLSGSSAPRRRRSRSLVNSHACDAPPLDQPSGPATPRLLCPCPDHAHPSHGWVSSHTTRPHIEVSSWATSRVAGSAAKVSAHARFARGFSDCGSTAGAPRVSTSWHLLAVVPRAIPAFSQRGLTAF